METAMTQLEITTCSKEIAKAMNIKLNNLENKIENSLKAEQIEQFIQSQISWRSMAENDCLIQWSFYRGGSIASTVYNTCMESRVEQRIEQIEYFLCPDWWMKGDCLEKDYSDS